MVKVSQNNPELETERGFDGTMLWNVLCFFYTSHYKSLQISEKSHENLWSKTVFLDFLVYPDVHYKCLMFIGHL